MKGITVIRDEQSGKRYVQIDVKLIEQDREAVEDHLDAILLECRRNEEAVPLANIERRLKRSRRR